MSVTAALFFDAVVVAIAKESDYTPHKPVSHKTVKDRVMASGLVSPDDIAEHGEKYIHKRIGWAFRNQRANTEKSTYCGDQKPLTVPGGRGKWALTEAGVAKAKALAPDTSVPEHVAKHFGHLNRAARVLAPRILRRAGEVSAAEALEASPEIIDRTSKRAVEDIVWSQLRKSKVKVLLCNLLQITYRSPRSPNLGVAPRIVAELDNLAA